MSSSELSELTSNVSTDNEEENPAVDKRKIEHYFKNPAASTQPPKLKKKRPPSPPHEYVLADREEIAFLVMFRSRFSDILPKSLSHLGPQDIENDITGSIPSDHVERLLCAILGLVLNRKKEVEKGHYTRALEDAIAQHTAQWPLAWQGRNPLHAGGTFNNMSPEEKLVLLKNLVFWSFDSSETVKAFLKDAYKQSRHEDDLNQPLSIQPWGRDGDKRRFWLIEGQDDTHFRLYRESNPSLKHVTWRSVAGTIDELKEVAEGLGEENTLASRRLRDRILAAIPRFEAGEDKRKRRDYRLARKAQFTRPEPGFSLYEGRTRGKRIKYTYSDEEGAASDANSTRRSNRQSGISTPAEPAGPRFTASGRQVRSRHGGEYGQSLLAGQQETDQGGASSAMDVDDDDEPITRGRSRRAAPTNGTIARRQRKTFDDSASVDSDAESDETADSRAWNGGDDDEDADREDYDEDEDDDSMSEDEIEVEEADGPNPSLVVRLRYGQSKSPRPDDPPTDSTASSQGQTVTHTNAPQAPKHNDQEMTDAPTAPTPMLLQPATTPPLGQNGIPRNFSEAGPRAHTHPSNSLGQCNVPSPNPPQPLQPSKTFDPHNFVYEGNNPNAVSKQSNPPIPPAHGSLPSAAPLPATTHANFNNTPTSDGRNITKGDESKILY